MRKKYVMILPVAMIALALVFLSQELYAASKDMVASKREVFQDDSVISMRKMFTKRQSEDKEHRETLMSNSEESVRLLREIRNLLRELNAKETK